MSRRLLGIFIVAAACFTFATGGFVAAQSAKTSTATRAAAPAKAATPDELYRRGTEAWEAGNYPEALTNLLAVMKGPDAAQYLDRVATLTGEVFTTTELTTDGRNPKISPNGQLISYEYGPTVEPMTRVLRIGASLPEVVAEVHGANITLGDTRMAWVRPVDNAEWKAAACTAQTATGTGRAAGAGALNALLAASGELVVRDIAAGTERVLPTAGLLKSAPQFGARDAIVFLGADPSDPTRSDIYVDNGAPVKLTTSPGFKTAPLIDPTGAALVYTVANASPFRAGGPGGGGGRGGGQNGPPPTFGIVDLNAKTTRIVQGAQVAMSANGQSLAWVTRSGDTYGLDMSPTLVDKPVVVRTGLARVNAPSLSADGSSVAYEYMTNTDWEIYVSDASGKHTRVTRDIQHDILPRFLTPTTLLGMMGEPRHRRSQLYDLTTGTRTRIFANNTIRTISPEYIWLPSRDGKRLVISAERDGDTVSVERGVYVVDLSKKVSVADVVRRITDQQVAENDLRSRMTRAYAPIADLVKKIVARASISRVYEHEKTLFDFDSKYVSQPGNNKAVDYLTKTYASFGYKPEQQWFSPTQAAGGKTANVFNVKLGTENPDLIYVVSSHFDSVVVGPGADDDTSGTAALLETARILQDVPLPATIIFASFTGEEGGLLGSREFVKLAAERKMNIVGALNNDMIGWGGESARMDNTIRYSNAGIRDIQHGASFFTNLILYDAKYYKGTDANSFYDGWGDIVGGLGSYPVLANPNYHQPGDLIETINFRQIAETTKVTAATLLYLASSPSRLKDLKVERKGGTTSLNWTASPEKGVRSYIVAFGPASDPMHTKMTVTTNHATLPGLPAGTQVAVKAVNARGLEGWDWAHGEVK